MGILKTVHVSCAVISITGFVIRGLWVIRQSVLPHQRWVKVIPHVIDSVLLITAILLAMRISQYPLVHGWLTAKVIALLVYIGLGMVALRYGRTMREKKIAYGLAIVVFGYIVLVAVTRTPIILV